MGLFNLIYTAVKYSLREENRREYKSYDDEDEYRKQILKRLNQTPPITEKSQPKTDIDITKWNLNLLQTVEWHRFEQICVNYFKLLKYKADLTGFHGDNGIDFIIYRKDNPHQKLAIGQCKAWKNKVGVAPIRELLGTIISEKVAYGFFMTTHDFTQDAKEFAQKNGIKLISGIALLEQIEKLPFEDNQYLLDIATKGDFQTPTFSNCGIKMVRKQGKNQDNKPFWGCRNFPKCRFTMKQTQL